MPITAEDRARHTIDRLLTDVGWLIQSRDETNINASRGVAIRGFPLKPGCGEADHLLYVSWKNQWRMKSEYSSIRRTWIGSWKDFRNSITLWPTRVNSGGYD